MHLVNSYESLEPFLRYNKCAIVMLGIWTVAISIKKKVHMKR